MLNNPSLPFIPLLLIPVMTGHLVQTCLLYTSIDADALLEIAATLLDMLHERRNAALDIYHQVREFHQTDHQITEIGIVLEIPVAHHTDLMKIRRKDTRIL